MRVTDLDTGKDFNLDRTPELSADLVPFYAGCDHSRRELRQRRNKGGAIQYIEQCLGCGESVGMFRKHPPDLAASPTWDDQIELDFEAKRKRDYETITQKHVRIQRGRTEGFWKEYNRYLQTEEWRQKRVKVFERAKGKCEGCGIKPATQVHHLTYKHAFAEFLFELVAVCDECHEGLHRDDTDSDEHRCSGCRWLTEHRDKVWCGMFDVAADEALAEDGDCGPHRSAFEPLK
jgi:hypothetical protein